MRARHSNCGGRLMWGSVLQQTAGVVSCLACLNMRTTASASASTTRTAAAKDVAATQRACGVCQEVSALGHLGRGGLAVGAQVKHLWGSGSRSECAWEPLDGRRCVRGKRAEMVDWLHAHGCGQPTAAAVPIPSRLPAARWPGCGCTGCAAGRPHKCPPGLQGQGGWAGAQVSRCRVRRWRRRRRRQQQQTAARQMADRWLTAKVRKHSLKSTPTHLRASQIGRRVGRRAAAGAGRRCGRSAEQGKAAGAVEGKRSGSRRQQHLHNNNDSRAWQQTPAAQARQRQGWQVENAHLLAALGAPAVGC